MLGVKNPIETKSREVKTKEWNRNGKWYVMLEKSMLLGVKWSRFSLQLALNVDK